MGCRKRIPPILPLVHEVTYLPGIEEVYGVTYHVHVVLMVAISVGYAIVDVNDPQAINRVQHIGIKVPGLCT